MANSELTQQIKKRLWTMYGSTDFPAEWDGNVYGGGKISQRFFEYLIAVEMLDLQQDSVVLDIGGGKGFFAALIAPFVKKVIILDEDQKDGTIAPNVEQIKKHAVAGVLSQAITREVTHISCISVFEHIPDPVREQIIRDIDASFSGERFVTTFEFHPITCSFEHQVTTATMNTMFSHFTKYYPERMEMSPLRAENAFGKATTPFNGRKTQYIGMWYPIAIQFSRM